MDLNFLGLKDLSVFEEWEKLTSLLWLLLFVIPHRLLITFKPNLDQNAGRNHSVRIDNSTFERVDEFKYLGTTLTNQNSIQEEIKSRLRTGNACYHSVQSLLSSRLLSKNLKTKIYRTIILPVVLLVWSLVVDSKGGKEAEGVWEYGVEENIWT